LCLITSTPLEITHFYLFWGLEKLGRDLCDLPYNPTLSSPNKISGLALDFFSAENRHHFACKLLLNMNYVLYIQQAAFLC